MEAAEWVRMCWCLHMSSDDLVGYLFSSPAACIISTAINMCSV